MKIDFENSGVANAIRMYPDRRFEGPSAKPSATMLRVGLGTKLQPRTFLNDPIMQKADAFNAMRFMLNRIGG